ncbi:hypothetical protein, partial [Roseospira goensis]
MTRITMIAIVALALSGCIPAVATGALMGAAGLYCAGTSGAGKQMARDRLTGGRPLIACPGADT